MEWKDYNKEPNLFEGLIPGRIVHYKTTNRLDNPALILAVLTSGSAEGLVSLLWWDEEGRAAQTTAYYDSSDEPFGWRWPVDVRAVTTVVS